MRVFRIREAADRDRPGPARNPGAQYGIRGRDVAVQDRRRNEERAPGDVAGGEDVRDGGGEELVDRHEPPRVEPDARGAYAGMIGYFGFDGNMDTCLAIRTMVGRGNTFTVQAGAGIVADSNPSTEYQETVDKASAMLKAIEMAETNS